MGVWEWAGWCCVYGWGGGGGVAEWGTGWRNGTEGGCDGEGRKGARERRMHQRPFRLFVYELKINSEARIAASVLNPDGNT